MGAQQSTGVVRQGPAPGSAASPSKQATSEELQRAYEKGKEESSMLFQDTLDKVASQVYNNIHEQLQGIRNSEQERTSTRVKTLSEGMDLVRDKTARGVVCAEAELALVSCLRSQADAGACAPAVSIYMQCAKKYDGVK